uniref:PRA1 family protein n=1 Tax=Chromera velia CCMP2878 TaxID=1169474 RepID=A0A0G4IC34_9ALVE|mmetsp:Transcript_56176/g.109998  ORF Transcript_56176/g.109998 Transcript_56176/m.109998 type:complete len:202 (-) Transcript_56176:207-812(-)|eukprot:Cvel_12913.t1-p1 / transcript=Cvel_12913.t1 / gene=Cvel_12913 / organism=Chromera_velia_CCMP2878 / gene_product=hypothetical protein / transcript_product=hypothetical protein / location=Cvel_scaffold863:22560-23267(+) / protein_length=201 / sequence_SO=supercontig / SO=protein_coding / is_pseudo=false
MASAVFEALNNVWICRNFQVCANYLQNNAVPDRRSEQQASEFLQGMRKALWTTPIGVEINDLRPLDDFIGKFAPPDHPETRIRSNFEYYKTNYLVCYLILVLVRALVSPGIVLIALILQYGAILTPMEATEGVIDPVTRVKIALSVHLVFLALLAWHILCQPVWLLLVMLAALSAHAAFRTRSAARLVSDTVRQAVNVKKE